MLLSSAERAACLDVAGRIAGDILDRAKVSGPGLSWDPGYSDRSPEDRRALERSLGFGTPGILLFLAEYFRQTNDAAVRDHIGAALERLHVLYSRTAEQQPGFYAGFWGGAFAVREVEKITGFVCGPHGVLALVPAAARAGREERADTGSGISNGVAGSLLGLDLLAGELDADVVRTCREACLRGMLRRLHPAATGLACGWHFDAIQPPLGFFSGSAGVRHVLSRYTEPGNGWAWICNEMRRYEDAAFSDMTGNWKDFLNEALFNAAESASALNRAAMRGSPALFERAGDAIGWGAGTAGIMLAHASEPGNETAVAAAHERALQRGAAKIESTLKRSDPGEDRFTLYDGWGGVALSMMHCLAGRPDPAMEEGLHRIVQRALAQYREHGRFRTRAWNEAASLSLLEGEAGIGYFLLKAIDGAAGGSVFRPMPTVDPGAEFSPASAQRTILRNALPLTIRLLGDSDLEFSSGASTDGFVASTATAVAAKKSELMDEVFDFETMRLTLRQATRSNLYLASREAYREQVRMRHFEQADDAAILRCRFRLTAEARLGVLPFLLPADNDSLPLAGQSTAILMHVRSDGMREVVLTPTAYGVLFRLSRLRSVGALLKRAHREWPLIEYDNIEARRLVVAIIRAGLADGYLESTHR